EGDLPSGLDVPDLARQGQVVVDGPRADPGDGRPCGGPKLQVERSSGQRKLHFAGLASGDGPALDEAQLLEASKIAVEGRFRELGFSGEPGQGQRSSQESGQYAQGHRAEEKARVSHQIHRFANSQIRFEPGSASRKHLYAPGRASGPPPMAKQNKNAGFQQAAGLIRYFDAEEETSIKIDPRIVLGMAFGVAIIVIAITLIFPLR